MLLHGDSPSLDASPFPVKSPRLYWEDRATFSPPPASENSPERSLSPEVTRRRSSLERLKSASRVKNSSMYAKETKLNYDPSSSPGVERPLNNRPWGGHVQNNVFARNDSIRKENSPFNSPEKPLHQRPEDQNISPSRIPAPAFSRDDMSASPRRDSQLSPARSSMAALRRFSPALEQGDSDGWSDVDEADQRVSTPRPHPRHVKSVTFNNSPPEVNEYEEQTPEPSSVASGSREGSYDSFAEDRDDAFNRDPNNEDSFDASLEDTDKTPVVLPEDWRNMSPDTARTDLVDEYDDVFEDRGRGSPSPTANPQQGQRPSLLRADSIASDASDFRPLPPIPGFASPRRGRNESPRGLAMAAERASSLQRGFQSTPPRAASVSKDEILRMREATMNLEDRMSLMALQETLAEVHRARNGSDGSMGSFADSLRRSAPKYETPSEEQELDPDESESEYLDDLPDYDAPSISRESILRNVKSTRHEEFDEYAEDSSPHSSPGRDYAELANLDPDVAIPSRENSTNFGYDAVIKEEEDSFMDLDAIPAIMADDENERSSSVIRHDVVYQDDNASFCEENSRYSSPMSDAFETDVSIEQGTPRLSAQPEPAEAQRDSLEHSNEKSLPLLGLGTDDYDFGLKEYITPSPPTSFQGEPKPEDLGTQQTPRRSVVNPPELFEGTTGAHSEMPRTPPTEEADFSDCDSLDSVMRDTITEEMLPVQEEDIPERRATIKTQGKLKARPSGNRADLQAMIQQRRQVSEEVPSIPDQYRTTSHGESESETDDMSTDLEAEEHAFHSDVESAIRPDDSSDRSHADSFLDKENRRQSRKELKLDLALPTDSSVSSGLGLGLIEEFDRVIEAQKVRPQQHPLHRSTTSSISRQAPPPLQGTYPASNNHYTPHARIGADNHARTQKGYLMRQNTKLVIASNRNVSNESQQQMSPPQSPTTYRGTKSAGNSPRKSSAGEKWLTAEPWNGKTRRKSTRRSSGRRSNIGVASPVVAQESSLGTVDEIMQEADDNLERGRLFVKVVGAKDLDLPLPQSKSFRAHHVMRQISLTHDR